MAAPQRFVLHRNDVPADLALGDTLAIDSEFMGLNVWRDRLCLMQIYDGKPDSKVHLVQFGQGQYDAPNLRRLLSDPSRQKLFFYARADMLWAGYWLGVIMENVYCLKIASRIARTYTQAHDLDDVLRHVLGVRISKEQQCTNWGNPELTTQQLDYACNDVLYLHRLKEKIGHHLARESRLELVQELCKCLPAVVKTDLAGWTDEDIFGYHVPKV